MAITCDHRLIYDHRVIRCNAKILARALLPLAGEGGRRSRPDEGRPTVRNFRTEIAEADS